MTEQEDRNREKLNARLLIIAAGITLILEFIILSIISR